MYSESFAVTPENVLKSINSWVAICCRAGQMVQEDKNSGSCAKRRHEVFNPSDEPGFADINETPDVAVWAKEKRAGVQVPADKVAEGRVTSPPRAISGNAKAKRASARNERLVDVADTEQVEDAAEQGDTLTDKVDLSRQ